MDTEIDFYCSYNTKWIFDRSKDIGSAEVKISIRGRNYAKSVFFFIVIIELDNINFSYNPKIKYAKMMHMHISIK